MAAPVGVTVVAFDRSALDVTSQMQVSTALAAERPDVVFNAAAYTAVDRAEHEEAQAFAINADAVSTLADATRSQGARFVHVSTDFVFNGQSGVPYAPEAAPDPINAYGRTKLSGERAAGPDALIVRTAWVYAPTSRNFVTTMLDLMRERSEVRVVVDQIGTPTYAPGLAAALWRLAVQQVSGIHHYTDSGVASWYDFAVAIQEEAIAAGLLDGAVPIVPIATSDYPAVASRPYYSVLDKQSTFAVLGGPAPHWRTQLRAMIEAVRVHG